MSSAHKSHSIEMLNSVGIILSFLYFTVYFFVSLATRSQFTFEMFFSNVFHVGILIISFGAIASQAVIRGKAIFDDYMHCSLAKKLSSGLLVCLSVSTVIFFVITVLYLHTFSSIFVVV